MTDRRIQKSRKIIQDSFLEILKEKSLNKITVTEICRKANVCRGTFYLHYQDVYDLYEKGENELYAGLYQIFENAFPSTDRENSRQLSQDLISYIEKHRDLFQILIRADNTYSLQKLKSAFNKKVLLESSQLNPKENKEFDQVEAIFVVSGIVGVLEKWLADGMAIPGGEIAAMLNRILCKVNVPAEADFLQPAVSGF